MSRVLRAYLGPASLLALAYLVVLIRLSAPAGLAGADTLGHLFRAEYLAQMMQEHGLGAYFTAAWMPDWYMGDPFRIYYPWLTTALLAPPIWVSNNPELAVKALVSLAAAGLAFGTFLALAWEWPSNPWQAGLGGVLVLLAPYQLRTIGFEGNLPRYLSLLALPPLLLASERILRSEGRRMPWVLLAAAGWLWAIAAHPQQAFMFAVGFALYVALRLFLDADLPLSRSLYWIAGVAAGAALSAAWTLPAYGRLELANVPNLPYEKVEIFAAPISALAPQFDVAGGAVAVGFGTLLLAVLAAISRPDPRRTAALISAAIAVWLSFGPGGVLFSLLPLSDQLLPERFLNFASFGFAVCAAGIVPFRNRARWARGAIVAALLLVDAVPALAYVRTAPIQPSELALGRVIDQTQLTPGNRWALLTYPEPRASEVYVVAQQAPTVNGWALENTPHHQGLRRYLSAVEWGPEYFEVLLERWAVGGVVLRAEGQQRAEAVASLAAAGWRQDQVVGPYEIWLDEEPPQVLQPIDRARILLLGGRLSPMLAAFPDAEEAEAPRLSQLPAGALEAYPAVALYRFAQANSGLEGQANRLRSYVEQGGHLLVELSGMEAMYANSLEFLDVSVIGLSLNEAAPLRWHDTSQASQEGMLDPGRAAASGWAGATYRGLDEVLAEIEFSGQWYPVLGYRDIGQGRVWFVGMNMFYYAQQAGDEALLNRLRQSVLQEVQLDEGQPAAEPQVVSWETNPGGFTLEYESEVPLPEALVSFTYFPRFEATVDGEPTSAGSFEHLIKVELPAGEHRLDVVHRPFATPVPILGWAISLLALVGLFSGYIYEKRTFVPELVGESEAQVEADQVHKPCANCGFLLSEVGEPTGVTYPFQVVSCPICGLSMDDDGFIPGDTLDEVERDRRLAEWLRQHDYDPETVHERWGFSPDSFFDLEGDAPDLPQM